MTIHILLGNPHPSPKPKLLPASIKNFCSSPATISLHYITLFRFCQYLHKIWSCDTIKIPCWGASSFGRALPWHGRGEEFESPALHQFFVAKTNLAGPDHLCPSHSTFQTPLKPPHPPNRPTLRTAPPRLPNPPTLQTAPPRLPNPPKFVIIVS